MLWACHRGFNLHHRLDPKGDWECFCRVDAHGGDVAVGRNDVFWQGIHVIRTLQARREAEDEGLNTQHETENTKNKLKKHGMDSPALHGTSGTASRLGSNAGKDPLP